MIEDDGALSARIAAAAGRLLMRLREGGLFRGAALGQAGDHLANALILRALGQMRPGDMILSEEKADGPARLGARRVWIVDPLDGTREYAEGRNDWAVHVGLAVDGQPIAGAVALPPAGRVFSTGVEAMAQVASTSGLRIAISRSRPPAVTASVAARLGADILPMGSAGAKAMAVLCGEAAAYLHAGGQHEWDSCAPVAVAVAHGLHASRLDGAPLVYNQPDPYVPDLLICRREWAAPILAAVAAAEGA